MIPSIVTAQTAQQRHADFRREAARAAIVAGEPGDAGGTPARRWRPQLRLRWSVVRPA
jgi:hypothetical protein